MCVCAHADVQLFVHSYICLPKGFWNLGQFYSNLAEIRDLRATGRMEIDSQVEKNDFVIVSALGKGSYVSSGINRH